MDKDVRKVIAAAVRQGWRSNDTRNGMMLFPPDKARSGVLIHKTPSDRRAWDNMLAQLRRSGLIWPPPRGE